MILQEEKSVLELLPDDLEELKAEIELLSKQIYVDRYLEIPVISVIQLQILNLYFYRSQFSDKFRKIVIVTTSLVQRGLDMHDQVTNQQETLSAKITERQMQILAGDYYSSICYQIMAKDNLAMHVRKLARGITINSAAKMQLYDFNGDNNFESNEELVNLLKVRESAIYTEFLTGDLKELEQQAWQAILANLILLKQISTQLGLTTINDNTLAFYLIRANATNVEMVKLYQSTNANDFQVMINFLYVKYEIKTKIMEIKDRLIEETNAMIELVEIGAIQNELRRFVKETVCTHS
jgi:hypothetical protein